MRGRRRRLEERQTAAAVPLVCRTIAAELRAGASPSTALAAAAGVAPERLHAVLVAAARTSAVGGHPAEALRVDLPGAGGLRLLAACWEVTTDVGAGLAAGCDRVGAACAADLRAEREITAALAGPRASALVLAGLPVAGLLLAAGLGADPLEFFLTVAGAATLVAGVTLDVLGVLWTRRLAAQALR